MNWSTRSDVVWFLRPTLAVLACYIVSIGVSYQMSQKNVDTLEQELGNVVRLAEETAGLKVPSRSLSPKQVVEIQLEALRDKDVNRGVMQCATFASPENFAVTGPLDNFAKIVRGGKFRVFASPDIVAVGDPVFVGENARVLVTVLAGRQTSAFVWVLAKQTSPPLNGCWMTDGVFSMDREDRWTENEI